MNPLAGPGALAVDIGDDHVGAVSGEQPRSRRADTSTAARHHRDPVDQQPAGGHWFIHAHILSHHYAQTAADGADS